MLHRLATLSLEQSNHQVISQPLSIRQISSGSFPRKKCIDFELGIVLYYIMSSEFINCPTDKDINIHFHDQMVQLDLHPATPEDKHQLMIILNSYLAYPDDQLANSHRNANKLGLLDLTASERIKLATQANVDQNIQDNIHQTKVLKLQSNTCRCCGFAIQVAEIHPCDSKLTDIKNLGPATHVFFKSFTHIAKLLLAMTVVYSIFAFVTNITTAYSVNYLNSSHQTLDYLSISLGSKSKIIGSKNNQGQNYYYVSSWLGVALMGCWWVMFALFKQETMKMERREGKRLGVSDYSIVIENMPTGFTREEIQLQFNEYLLKLREEYPQDSITVNDIKVAKYNEGKPFYLNEDQFKDQELSDIHTQYQKVRSEIAGFVVEHRDNNRFLTKTAQRRHSYSRYEACVHRKKVKYDQIVRKIRTKLNQKQQVSRTVVFVTFVTYQMRQFVLAHNRNSLFYRIKRTLQCWKTSDYFTVRKGDIIYDDITVEQPPQPEDIHWGNLGLSSCQKFVRFCFTAFASLVMIGVCFVIVYALSTVQYTPGSNRYISILISLAISAANLLIIKVIQYMTNIQKIYTMNNFQISIAIKSVAAQLVNFITVPLIVNFYIKDRNIFGEGGLIEDIFILAITSSFIPPLVRLLDPYHLFLALRYKYYHNEVRRLYLSQYELNDISEKMQFQIGMQYIYLISNFLFICFYVSLQPVISLFGLLSLLFMYWIQKYSLLNRCQRPVPGPDVITSTMYQMIFFGSITFVLGNLTWSWFLPDVGFRGSILPNLIAAGIALVAFIFPYDFFKRQEDLKESTKNYYQKRIYFPSEYDRLNPSTSKLAIQQYRNFLNEKKRQLQLTGDQSMSEQIFRGLAGLSQNNIYKGNFMNRFTLSAEDLIIQRIFNNESRNIVNPQQLLSALLPEQRKDTVLRQGYKQTKSQHFPTTQVNIGPSMKDIYQEPTSKQMINENEQNIYPNLDPEQFNNVYGSNFKIDNILALDSNIEKPKKKDRLDVDHKNKK